MTRSYEFGEAREDFVPDVLADLAKLPDDGGSFGGSRLVEAYEVANRCLHQCFRITVGIGRDSVSRYFCLLLKRSVVPGDMHDGNGILATGNDDGKKVGNSAVRRQQPTVLVWLLKRVENSEGVQFRLAPLRSEAWLARLEGVEETAFRTAQFFPLRPFQVSLIRDDWERYLRLVGAGNRLHHGANGEVVQTHAQGVKRIADLERQIFGRRPNGLARAHRKTVFQRVGKMPFVVYLAGGYVRVCPEECVAGLLHDLQVMTCP